MKNKNNKKQQYKYTAPLSPSLFEDLTLQLVLSKNSNNTTAITYFDTFDWRLFKNNLVLLKKSEKYFLYNFKKLRTVSTFHWTLRTIPYFYTDFPDSKLKKELSKKLSIRSLLPITSFNEKEIKHSILNEEDKTVAWLIETTVKFGKSNSDELSYLTLESVRGYNDVFTVINSLLKKERLTPINNSPYIEALIASGIQPGSYSSKFNLKIYPDISSDEAIKQILTHLVNTMKINEEGIRKDIDTEFLHDFRVAVRRARSAISQIKYIFPDKITLKLKDDFSSIGKLTNRLRDLDVYLLKKDEYKEILPEKLRKGIKLVFNKLENERKKEQRKLKTVLSANNYRNKIKDAEKCIQNNYTDEELPKNSNVPILLLTKKVIWKKYNKVVSKGLLIEDSSPDVMLHELRIECKKLRYLLEFFSSLFTAKKMDIIISQLKKLQDNLGDFNDFYVQQANLEELLEEYGPKDDDYKNVSMSIGALMAILGNKQLETRNDFKKIFSEFAKQNNREFYQKLFVDKK